MGQYVPLIDRIHVEALEDSSGQENTKTSVSPFYYNFITS